MDDLDVDPIGDGPVRVADGQVAAADGRASPWRDARAADGGGGGVDDELLDLEFLELLLLRLRPRGGRGAGLVAVDEVLELAALGEDGGIGPLDVFALFLLELEIGVDLPGEDGQFPVGEVEGLVAGGGEEGPVVGNDQAGFLVAPEEVLEEDLRPQVEEVGRFVEEEERRLVEEQRGELDARLPAAGELRHRALELGGLELELPGDFAALPVGLGAVADQKLERRLAGEKRIMLPQIAQPEPGEADDVAGVELLFAEDDPQEGALAGAVAADEPDLAVVGDRGGGVLEEDLMAIPLRGVLDVEENGHRRGRWARWGRAGRAVGRAGGRAERRGQTERSGGGRAAGGARGGRAGGGR